MSKENNLSILVGNGINITRNSNEWKALSDKHDIKESEIRLIDFNRTGVYLPNNEVRVNFRVRFVASENSDENSKTWYALPVRKSEDSNFWASENFLSFQDEVFAHIGPLYLDTCDTSYQRGDTLLNLNSRSRGNCGGCVACVHNYKDLYDETVLKDQKKMITKEDIEHFFEEKVVNGLDISKLKQIAVVTGLFGSETAVVEHMKLIYEVVKPMGFNGEFMYFGCEVNSEKAMEELANLGNFSLIYAVDNFTKRDKILAQKKSSITIEHAKKTLDLARRKGIETSFAYISGIDSLEEMEKGMIQLRESVSRFPVINIYQVQTEGQIAAMDLEAKKLEYYIQTRKIVEKVFRNTGLSPRRWENYRPLWYEIFDDKKLLNNSFGD